MLALLAEALQFRPYSACVFAALGLAATSPNCLAVDVAAHIAAGEFGLAQDALANEGDPALKAQLAGNLASAQARNGQGRASLATIRRQANPSARRGVQPVLEGGAAGADFTELMALIQQNTGGDASWEEDGGQGTMSPFANGVKVDPSGLLQVMTPAEHQQQLTAIRQQARAAVNRQTVSTSSDLRFLSLKKIEAEVSAALAEGRALPASIANLGGLTSLKYVIALPEEQDLVLAGPADAWGYNDLGQAISVTSQQPTLQLDDLVVVLRSMEQGQNDFGCSINIRPEGVQALQNYVNASKDPLDPRSVKSWVGRLEQKLGAQDVVVWGVPAESRVARVLVEADYRMKLVGLDRHAAGQHIKSYFDLLPAAVQKNPPALEALRWWLTLKCDAVQHSEDKLTFAIAGSSVLCQSENQFVTADGKNVGTGTAEDANRLFAEGFTEGYQSLAAHDPVFADARNVFDMALVASLIHEGGLAQQSKCSLGVFESDGEYRTAKHTPPTAVASVANHRVYNGKNIVVQVAGGVRVDARSPVRKAEPAAALNTMLAPAAEAGRETHAWWWDAK